MKPLNEKQNQLTTALREINSEIELLEIRRDYLLNELGKVQAKIICAPFFEAINKIKTE